MPVLRAALCSLLFATALAPSAHAARTWADEQLAGYPVGGCHWQVPATYASHHDLADTPRYGNHLFDAATFQVGLYWWAWPHDGALEPAQLGQILDSLEVAASMAFERDALAWQAVGEHRAAVIPYGQEGHLDAAGGQFLFFVHAGERRAFAWWILPTAIEEHPGVSATQVSELMAHAAAEFRCDGSWTLGRAASNELRGVPADWTKRDRSDRTAVWTAPSGQRVLIANSSDIHPARGPACFEALGAVLEVLAGLDSASLRQRRALPPDGATCATSATLDLPDGRSARVHAQMWHCAEHAQSAVEYRLDGAEAWLPVKPASCPPAEASP